jgi:hypothetical protein
MGEEIRSSHFDEQDFLEFESRLLAETGKTKAAVAAPALAAAATPFRSKSVTPKANYRLFQTARTWGSVAAIRPRLRRSDPVKPFSISVLALASTVSSRRGSYRAPVTSLAWT